MANCHDSPWVSECKFTQRFENDVPRKLICNWSFIKERCSFSGINTAKKLITCDLNLLLRQTGKRPAQQIFLPWPQSSVESGEGGAAEHGVEVRGSFMSRTRGQHTADPFIRALGTFTLVLKRCQVIAQEAHPRCSPMCAG